MGYNLKCLICHPANEALMKLSSLYRTLNLLVFSVTFTLDLHIGNPGVTLKVPALPILAISGTSIQLPKQIWRYRKYYVIFLKIASSFQVIPNKAPVAKPVVDSFYAAIV